LTTDFRFQMRPVLVCGPGSISQAGGIARDLGFKRTLAVSDPGLVAAGHAARAERILAEAGIFVTPFHHFGENPDSRMVEEGRAVAADLGIDSMVAIGGGSSLDCAKGINFVLTNGGRIQDYLGYGKASSPMLPMIGIPTTTGTGSEAQSYALISDADSHRKLACGDPGASFRVAILDPELALSQPRRVRAVTGYDAISHAVESHVSTKASALSRCFTREAWGLLNGSFEQALRDESDLDAIAAMQLGAFYSGLAVENSMLGAAHACANPLTQHYGTIHGAAIAHMLPAVVEWNAEDVASLYEELHPSLASRLMDLAQIGGLATSLKQAGVPLSDLPTLAANAAEQWTGRFNPRPFDAASARSLYERAWYRVGK
jgi:alcohol dehydrogenase